MVMEKEGEEERIRVLLKSNPKGLTIEEVSKKLSMSRATAVKYLNKMVVSGQSEMRNLGPAKLFYLTNRLPLTSLLSLSSDLILVLNKDLFIQEVNSACISFFRIAREELKGTRIDYSPLAPCFSAEHLEALHTALDGQELSFDVCFDDQGTDRFFKMKYLPLVREDGERSVGIILEDITEMKQYQNELEARIRERTEKLIKTNAALQHEIEHHVLAEQALRESEERFRQVAEMADELIWEIDPEGIFRYCSTAVKWILGYRPEELVGKIPCYDLFPPEKREEYKNIFLGAFVARKKLQDFIFPVIHKNGSRVCLEMTGVPLYDPSGKFIGYRGVCLDITDRKRADDAVKKANKQLILLNSITRHDILNQLSSFTGYLEMLKSMEPDGKTHELLVKTGVIAETIRRMISFTRDYQNIGVNPPQWKRVSDVLLEALRVVDKGGVTVTVDVEGLEIYSDSLIEKVFFNLIENSLRHGQTVKTIHIRYILKEKDLHLVYEDDGVGIPPEEKAAVFERGHGKNTGYGLFLAREILAITGLSISETGTPGEGVRFVILVPQGSFRFRDLSKGVVPAVQP